MNTQPSGNILSKTEPVNNSGREAGRVRGNSREHDSNEFVQNIQKWVILDKQLKFVNEKTRQIRQTKSELTTHICDYMQQKQWTNKPIDITDGVIKFVEKREYSPLSFGYIEECLDELIQDESQVDRIIQYLKDHREVKTSCEIRRFDT